MADLLAAATAQATDQDSHRTGSILGISSSQLNELKQQAIAYAAAHGMLVGAPPSSAGATNETPNFTHIPFCLLPVQFPAAAFARGIQLSPLYGRLVDRVSRDLPWLHQTLESVVSEDAFTARLLQLSQLVEKEGILQKTYLGIHRSDYMLHEADGQQRLLQVELNTIASSFGCLSSLTSGLHRFMMMRCARHLPALEDFYQTPSTEFASHIPANEAMAELPASMAAAHRHYGVQNAIVVFIVQPNEANSIDQRWLEYKLFEDHGIPVVRKSLTEIHTDAVLTDREGRDRTLVVDGQEVALVYFRAGYTPTDYPSDAEWKARTLLERSFAIKCPSIAYHLAGTKKVQQALASPATLRRFTTSEEEAVALESSFAGLYGLESTAPDLEEIKAKARGNPMAFVLKPQREGGGNNLYGQSITEALNTWSPQELESYILMERIFPHETPAVLVRNRVAVGGKTLSELGLYVTCLFDDGRELLNAHAGHLLRTKLTGTDEGGVASGFSVLSSPFLS